MLDTYRLTICVPFPDRHVIRDAAIVNKDKLCPGVNKMLELSELLTYLKHSLLLLHVTAETMS